MDHSNRNLHAIMKTKHLITTALATALAAQSWAAPPKMKMTTEIPESITTSIGTLMFEGQAFPTVESKQKRTLSSFDLME